MKRKRKNKIDKNQPKRKGKQVSTTMPCHAIHTYRYRTKNTVQQLRNSYTQTNTSRPTATKITRITIHEYLSLFYDYRKCSVLYFAFSSNVNFRCHSNDNKMIYFYGNNLFPHKNTNESELTTALNLINAKFVY